MKTLYVIGNGFDIHHEIESRYWDFWESKSANLGYWETILACAYPVIGSDGELLLWSSLEEALGHIDPKSVYQEANDGEEIDYDHVMRSTAALSDRPAEMLSQALTSLHKSFEDWVNHIDLGAKVKDQTLSELSADDLYLSFNYTETLEYLYDIPRKQIAYLHGRRNTNDTIILGHHNFVDAEDYKDNDSPLYEDEAYEQIAKISNNQLKDTQSIIASFAEFWQRIRAVDRVVVYGLSYGEVDIPYLETILESVDEDTPWLLSYYSEQDKISAETVIARLGIKNARAFEFKEPMWEE